MAAKIAKADTGEVALAKKPDPNLVALKKRVQEERERSGIYIEDLANRLRPLLQPLGERTGWSYASVQAYLDTAGKGRNRRPRKEWIEAAAKVFGVRAEYLLTGEGPRTEQDARREEEADRRRFLEPLALSPEHHEAVGEALVHALPQTTDAPIIFDLETGKDHRARRRRAALFRFARKLDDVTWPDAPWSGADERRDLLRAAHTFLTGTEHAFEEAGGWRSDARMGAEQLRGALDHLLLRDGSEGWYVAWSDAALDLFARRVYGLGERPIEQPTVADDPAPISEHSPAPDRTARARDGGRKPQTRTRRKS